MSKGIPCAVLDIGVQIFLLSNSGIKINLIKKSRTNCENFTKSLIKLYLNQLLTIKCLAKVYQELEICMKENTWSFLNYFDK